MADSIYGKYKVNLYPNNATDGTPIDWAERIKDPIEWRMSEKYDGIRCQIHFDEDGNCTFKTRSLKPFRSIWIKDLELKLQGAIKGPIWIEGEIWCPGMMFNELQHFFLSENVTTGKAIKKTRREMEKDGKFEGRTLEWLSTYNHQFGVMLFDCFIEYAPKLLFYERQSYLREAYISMNAKAWNQFALITQLTADDLGGIINYYNEIVERGGEGIILKHEGHVYKFGRNTIKECKVFKMIDEFREFTGIVTDVSEGTIVDPMLIPETNELGYSKTSKLKEDRMPSGRAKGFEVDFEGQKLTVTLKGFTNEAKQFLLATKQSWIGREITFLGKPATKTNGVPRQAKYIKQ